MANSAYLVGGDDPEPARPTEPLTRALRWFDTNSQADVAGYDAITYYDATNSDAGTMARGYRCGRRVPWNSEPGD